MWPTFDQDLTNCLVKCYLKRGRSKVSQVDYPLTNIRLTISGQCYECGKNVIITGASTGIGEQMAYHYARLGANIVITAWREQQLQKVIGKCRKIGNKNGEYDYISLDMLDQNEPEST